MEGVPRRCGWRGRCGFGAPPPVDRRLARTLRHGVALSARDVLRSVRPQLRRRQRMPRRRELKSRRGAKGCVKALVQLGSFRGKPQSRHRQRVSSRRELRFAVGRWRL